VSVRGGVGLAGGSAQQPATSFYIGHCGVSRMGRDRVTGLCRSPRFCGTIETPDLVSRPLLYHAGLLPPEDQSSGDCVRPWPGRAGRWCGLCGRQKRAQRRSGVSLSAQLWRDLAIEFRGPGRKGGSDRGRYGKQSSAACWPSRAEGWAITERATMFAGRRTRSQGNRQMIFAARGRRRWCPRS
jgi:hypothetical protein